MEDRLIRLECLRLASSKSPDHQEMLKRAEEFVDFVNKNPEHSKQAPEGKTEGDKKSGNFDDLKT